MGVYKHSMPARRKQVCTYSRQVQARAVKCHFALTVDRWMDGWMDGRTDGWMDGWMGGWVDGWVDRWTDGWMDGWMEASLLGGCYR